MSYTGYANLYHADIVKLAILVHTDNAEYPSLVSEYPTIHVLNNMSLSLTYDTAEFIYRLVSEYYIFQSGK
jgi:hypothetical protein